MAWTSLPATSTDPSTPRRIGGPTPTPNAAPATGRHTETYTDRTDTAYDYDSQGRLWHVTVKELNGQVLTTPQVTTYTYDAAGNKTTETLPDGEVTTYTYDDLNRLTGVVEVQGATTLFSQQFILKDDGTRKSVDETQRQPDGSTVASHTDWTYDDDGRLTAEVVTSGLTTGSFSDAYSFDLANNRVRKVHASSAGTDTITSTYNGDDQLTTTADGASGTTTAYAYDADGSQTDDGTHRDVYDARNRLVRVTDENNNLIAGYVYDDAGNRVQETAGGKTTYYVIDADNPTGYPKPVEQWVSTNGNRSAATLNVTYVLGDRVLAQADGSGAVAYLLADGHGATRLLTNGAGGVSATFNYDAFGNAVGFDASAAGTAWLVGDGMYDGPSGLVFHGSGRQSSSVTGEFVQADPQGYGANGDPMTLHKYLYANGDPVNVLDPSGHEGLAQLLVTVGINVALNAITFGALGFAWAKARGLRNHDAFLYALKVGEAGALVSLPVIGPIAGLYYLYQAYESYRAGQWDNLTGWELASYIAAGVLMNRISPTMADSIVKGGNTPAPVDGPPAPEIKFNIQDTVTGPRIEVNIGGQSIIIYSDSVVVEGDTVTLKNVDIGSDLTNKIGISKLRAIAKGLSGQYGVSKVVIEGGVRTTGANPGRAPSVEFDFSGGTDSSGTVKP